MIPRILTMIIVYYSEVEEWGRDQIYPDISSIIHILSIDSPLSTIIYLDYPRFMAQVPQKSGTSSDVSPDSTGRSSLLMVPSPEESIVMKSFFTFLQRRARRAGDIWDMSRLSGKLPSGCD